MLGISKNIENRGSLERALRSGIKGDVLLDQVTRGLYATDASIYQQEPVAVVIPRDRGDVAHAIKVARERKIPILPRGGGTSLAGQTTGRAIVIDFSKCITALIETNVPEAWARVEPGRVRDELNALIAETGLHFAPETATSNRANIGGMIANNSSGTKSIVYGKTVDHVLELDVLLATGEELHLHEMTREQWDRIAESDTREGRLYRGVRDVIASVREEIPKRFPKVMRRVGGYNLDEFPAEGPWNMAKLVTGSEGTLAAVLEAKINLEPLPRAQAVCVAHFKKMPEALRAVPIIVGHGPAAVEIIDKTVIDMARNNLEASRLCDWVEGDPAAVLLIEFFGDSMDQIQGKFDAVIADLKAASLGYTYPRMFDPDVHAKVWGVRASGLGLMLGMKGDAKPTAFIEDSAVPVEALPEYIAEVLEVCRARNVPAAMYAHASVGLIHVRPILDLKKAEDIENMKVISEKTFELVKKYGGSWSGEHGDGLVRSYMNERFFGPKIYGAFKEIKKLFDPDGIMNPGKIVDAPPIDEELRFGVQYRALTKAKHYHFREDGGFDRAIEMCTGVGACRKTLGGTMCPSYMATRDEAHSTRGRANALRLAMSGQFGPGGMTSPELYGVLDLCLGCKGCKAECPSNVDLARLKGEFLAGYHEKHGARLGERFFAYGPQSAARLAGPLAPLVNFIGEFKPARAAMEKLFGFDRRRPMPRLAREPFPEWFRKRMERRNDPKARRVALFDDSFMNYHEPAVGRSAARLLEALGYRVTLANAGCCGRALISMGFLKEAKTMGLQTLKKLHRYAVDEVPVVGCEPSCVSALTDDLPDLAVDPIMARRASENVRMIDVFLAEEIEAGRLDPDTIREKALRTADRAAAPPRFLIHGHCHQKALFGTRAMKTLLGCIENAEVHEIDSGCCGMAGSFGYEKVHYDLSMKIGEDRLFPAVRGMEPGARLIASGFSCRHQIADATGARARHFVEVMAEFLTANPD